MTARAPDLAISIAALVAVLALGAGWPTAILVGLAVAIFGEAFRRLTTAPPASAPPRPLVTAGRPDALPPLSRAETRVGRLLATGLSNKLIAKRIDRDERTVENHIQHARDRLGGITRVELAIWITQHDIDPDLSTREEEK